MLIIPLEFIIVYNIEQYIAFCNIFFGKNIFRRRTCG